MPADAQPYDERFYAAQRDGSYASARVVLGRLAELYTPASVIDVGCVRPQHPLHAALAERGHRPMPNWRFVDAVHPFLFDHYVALAGRAGLTEGPQP